MKAISLIYYIIFIIALQHQLLVCNMRIDVPPKRKFTPSLKVWKLKDPQTNIHFKEVFNSHVCADVADAATKAIWNNIKTDLLKITEEVCGTTRPHRWRCDSWGRMSTWKRQLLLSGKLSRPGRLVKASYDAAKRIARHAVHHARQGANKNV